MTAFSQQVNLALGTAFAFVVKMFFTISIGTAYWQVFWHAVKANAITLSRIDTLSSVLGNVLEFFHVRTFARFPVLFILAALAW